MAALSCQVPSTPLPGASFNGSDAALGALCSAGCGGNPEIYVEPNVPLAFGLVAAAGMSTSIGAAFVFWNGCAARTNHTALAASLGFSAGVMLYVSFAEILIKSVTSFSACDCLWVNEKKPDAPAKIVATATFLCGVVLFKLIHLAVHVIMPKLTLVRRRRGGDPHSATASADAATTQSSSSSETAQRHETAPAAPGLGGRLSSTPSEATSSFATSLALGDGAEQVHSDQAARGVAVQGRLAPNRGAGGASDCVGAGEGEGDETQLRIDVDHVCPCDHHFAGEKATERSADRAVLDLDHMTEEERRSKLAHMGIMTALAIGLHNFPEGLATFAGALADPSVGVALAVAIAIHNIPEGLCVAMPIYYATGSRCLGFWLATVSGMAEIVGAALGYAVLMSVLGPGAYGALFGLVAGLMVAIVVSELLPTAHRYDPHDRVCTLSVFAGMTVMAVSLVLFQL
jgi:ZIP family zinc transporter